ncbi:MAG: ergothioneine biosynthesis protein EgtB [Acidobacteriota bacterium]
MERQELIDRFRRTRDLSNELCQPLAAEDFRIQSMPDVSPPWWNLGHTTWFFAKNVLEPHTGENLMTPKLEYVLNSYYVSLGPRIPRHDRGKVTRPTTDEIRNFRKAVDGAMVRLLEKADDTTLDELTFLVTTGIHHEQQHQELLITEIKHILGTNVAAYREPYRAYERNGQPPSTRPSWIGFAGGVNEFGNVEGGWCWDNELPVHKAWLDDFEILDRLVTNGEYRAFIEAGGYDDALLWLSNGWATAQEEGWRAPLYWEQAEDGSWQMWTLGGNRPLADDEPVVHVSFYEADAFVRWKAQTDDAWKNARLPTEREWEHAARFGRFDPQSGTFLDDRVFHPQPANGDCGLRQMAGELWEWTSNHYEAYPGYAPFDGNLMEYNGKFMDNQRVLRGGSVATPRDHIRPSYRNFWHPSTQFQMTGIRAARGRT